MSNNKYMHYVTKLKDEIFVWQTANSSMGWIFFVNILDSHLFKIMPLKLDIHSDSDIHVS